MALDKKYVIMTIEDARALALSPETTADSIIADSINADTGADLRELAEALKKIPICTACGHEGMAGSCNALDAQKLGRRLARLVERADSRSVSGAKGKS